MAVVLHTERVQFEGALDVLARCPCRCGREEERGVRGHGSLGSSCFPCYARETIRNTKRPFSEREMHRGVLTCADCVDGWW